jgi:hypothetical protein
MKIFLSRHNLADLLTTCVVFSKNFLATLQQGDQVGRFFAYNVIIYFWQFVLTYRSGPNFCVTFCTVKVMLLILTKTGGGQHLRRFLPQRHPVSLHCSQCLPLFHYAATFLQSDQMILRKKSPKTQPYPFVSELTHDFHRSKKVAPKMCATFVIDKTLHKVNNRPMGENSPNPVPLLSWKCRVTLTGHH